MPPWHKLPFYKETRITSVATAPTRAPLAARPSRARELASRPLSKNDPEITISFRVRASKAPALRSAVDEISGIVGARLEGSHRFSKEFALTDAAITLGALRAAVNAATPAGDQNYV